jgi:hypothetical protein
MVRPVGAKSGVALLVDEPGCGIGEAGAGITDAFFLRRVFNHSRMRAANSASSRKVQASSRIRSVGRPSRPFGGRIPRTPSLFWLQMAGGSAGVPPAEVRAMLEACLRHDPRSHSEIIVDISIVYGMASALWGVGGGRSANCPLPAPEQAPGRIAQGFGLPCVGEPQIIPGKTLIGTESIDIHDGTGG